MCCNFRLKNLGLNFYLYAPKDDIKHRALWREMYTPEELGMSYVLCPYFLSIVAPRITGQHLFPSTKLT